MRRLYLITRDLHLYFGLFVSPFVIVFAVSVFFLDHAKIDTSATTSSMTVRNVTIPAGLEAVRGREAADRARELLARVGVDGEIGFLHYVRNERRLIIPVSKPGLETMIDVDLSNRTVVISRRPTGVLESIGYLHKSPGPHNADIRGNWAWTRAWRWLADGTVYLLLFISATGLYLWFTIKAERRFGLILIGAGIVSFGAFIYVLAS